MNEENQGNQDNQGKRSKPMRMVTMTARDWIGKEISSYRIIKVLGTGGMGIVFLAEHIRLGTKVAIKLINVPNLTDELLTRFEDEARALVSLSGIQGVADFLEFTVEPLALITKFVEGKDLETILSEEQDMGNLETKLRLFDIAIEVIEAMVEVHARGVIHRDLKPENIMMSASGPRLIDFGISRLRKKEDDAQLTTADSWMGTPFWGDPRLFRTPDKIDASADVFSVCLLLYLIFGGRHFYGDSRLYGGMSIYEIIGKTGEILQNSTKVEQRLSFVFSEIAQIIREGIKFHVEDRLIHTMVDLLDACKAARSIVALRARGIFPEPIPYEEPKVDVNVNAAVTAVPEDSEGPSPGETSLQWGGSVPPNGAPASAEPPLATPTLERQAAETVTEEPALALTQEVEVPLAKKGLSLTAVILMLLVAMGGTLGITLAFTRKSSSPSLPAKTAKTKPVMARPMRPIVKKLVRLKPRPKPMARKPVMARPTRPIVKPVVKVTPKPAKPKKLDPCKRVKGKQAPSDACLALKCKRKGYTRPSVECIALHYKRAKHECPKHGELHSLLSCLNSYADTLRGGKYSKDFRKVSLAVLFLDEVRMHSCFRKRYWACSGRNKHSVFRPNHSRRTLLWGKCWNLHYKVISSPKRWADGWLSYLTNNQRKKVEKWMGKSAYLRRQDLIRTAWIKATLKKHPQKMACLKRK